MRTLNLLIFILLAAIAFGSSSATIINVPADYSTIQMAIDSSSNSDTVLVQPNTYIENINFKGHNIVLGSLFLTTGDTSFISSTIIDGNHAGRVVRFTSGETNDAKIIGFKIQNGDYSYGGGICCYNSNPNISHNTISGNSVNDYGGGISCENSNPVISHNTISGNSSGNVGGGIACVGSSPTISQNTISGNSAEYSGGGIYCHESSPTIGQNTIRGNSVIWNGGGIYCFLDSSPIIANNTLSGNSAQYYGGGIYCRYNSNPLLSNTIFWGNNAATGAEIHVFADSYPVITYCDVQDTLWPGQGNINIDPLFRDIAGGDFHLMSTACGDTADSPCIDAGDPTICDLLQNCNWGLGDRRSDMGAYGGGINCSEIPALSEWGMLIMALLLLAAGTVAVVRRRKETTTANT